MKITTEHLKDILDLERYNYKDVIGASPFTFCELESKNRNADMVMWRQFLVCVARIEGLTFANSGKLVNQNHATVIHSMRSVYERTNDKQYPEYGKALMEIKKHIEFNLIASDDICVNEANCLIMLDNLIAKKLGL